MNNILSFNVADKFQKLSNRNKACYESHYCASYFNLSCWLGNILPLHRIFYTSKKLAPDLLETMHVRQFDELLMRWFWQLKYWNLSPQPECCLAVEQLISTIDKEHSNQFYLLSVYAQTILGIILVWKVPSCFEYEWPLFKRKLLSETFTPNNFMMWAVNWQPTSKENIASLLNFC